MHLAIARAQVYESGGAIPNIQLGHGLRPNTHMRFAISGEKSLTSGVSLCPEGIARLLSEGTLTVEFVSTTIAAPKHTHMSSRLRYNPRFAREEFDELHPFWIIIIALQLASFQRCPTAFNPAGE